MIKTYLKLEGFAVFALSVYVYFALGFGWAAFLFLLLVPDVSMLGYLKDSKTGATIYNAGHTYLVPGLLGAIGYGLDANALLAASLIWIAHIGMDRMLGYGLKRFTGFKDTHLT